MNDLRAAARQALQALESLFSGQFDPESGMRCGNAVLALKAALAQEPEQEPVAWTATRLWNRKELWTCPADIERDLLEGYAHPPRCEWVSLTEEEIGMLYVTWDDTPGVSMADFARAIEQACKERNT
jgi:hypothetical protein